jgi:hypothetical protein
MSASPVIDFFRDVGSSITSDRGQLRFVIQPLMATVLGARLGISDAREGRAPFLLRLGKASKQRGQMMRQSLWDVVIPFCLAIVIDSLIQHYTIGYVRPVAAVLVALLIVWLPYSISRALTNRIYRRRHPRVAA